MRSFLGAFLSAAVVGSSVHGGERTDELFERWEQAQRGVRSLVVKFTLERNDPVFKSRDQAEGTLRLIRTPKNEIFATYHLVRKKPKGESPESFFFLLHKGSLYLLKDETKTALRIEAANGDLLLFLERYFNPFVVLLKKKHAEETCKLELLKQDKWYTYLAVNPNKVQRYGWFSLTLREGRVVLMNQSSAGVPKDMPKQLWYTDGIDEYTFEIELWELNGVDAPKPNEFTHPRERSGWKVIEKMP